MLLVFESGFHSSSVWALVIFYIKYMLPSSKTKFISFAVHGIDYFDRSHGGSDHANFLPVPVTHGVGISGAGFRVHEVQSGHLVVR